MSVPYISNNIEFRIVSATAISSFKTNQAFDLNELVHNKNYSFSYKNREILLLSYDAFFSYVLYLEKLFIANKDITQEHVKQILQMYDNTIENINQTYKTNNTYFDEKTIAILNQTHQVFLDYGKIKIRKACSEKSMIAFPKICNIISDILHNLLYEIHEIDSILTKTNDMPFVSFSNMCDNILKENVDVIYDRIKIYLSFFPNQKNYTVKNYACSTYPNNQHVSELGIQLYNY